MGTENYSVLNRNFFTDRCFLRLDPQLDQFWNFLNKLDRYECGCDHNYLYFKGIRVTLLAFGYDPAYINGTFREILEGYLTGSYSQEDILFSYDQFLQGKYPCYENYHIKSCSSDGEGS